jgi:hypothetical protein
MSRSFERWVSGVVGETVVGETVVWKRVVWKRVTERRKGYAGR